jgi:hypothetical protein
MAIRAELMSRIPKGAPTDIRPSPPPRVVELTSQQKADIAETERRTSAGVAQSKILSEQARTAALERQNWRPFPFGDFTHYTVDQAKTQLAALEKVASTPMVKKGLFEATMGDQKTTSPQVMIDWLRQKIGGDASSPESVKPGALLNLSA